MFDSITLILIYKLHSYLSFSHPSVLCRRRRHRGRTMPHRQKTPQRLQIEDSVEIERRRARLIRQPGFWSISPIWAFWSARRLEKQHPLLKTTKQLWSAYLVGVQHLVGEKRVWS
ncbi:hypothetical protein RchiOBHm_Chr4g0425281 [Rosa chinensis]|uniref:Uncharacterized protein n=1 Tax=Rosa chinensis TaxID=74649 RepID=A0A2P6QZ30_ROSCH|nr:hypothetical protein RchiOBHm_Chr4g0425281 [Rosa chinensis]